MPTAAKFRIAARAEGIGEFTRGLAACKQGVRNRVLRKVVTAGTQIVLVAARNKARTIGRSGVLARAMVKKVKTYPRAVVGIVGAAKDKGQDAEVWSWWKDRAHTVKRYVRRRTVPANILHLIELGTKAHALGKGSKLSRRRKAGPTVAVQHGQMHPGSRAQPVLAPAWDESKGPAKSVMLTQGSAAVKAEVARAWARASKGRR